VAAHQFGEVAFGAIFNITAEQGGVVHHGGLTYSTRRTKNRTKQSRKPVDAVEGSPMGRNLRPARESRTLSGLPQSNG
jgi:hypothetical protein